MTEASAGEGRVIEPHSEAGPAFRIHWDREWCRSDLESNHSASAEEIELRLDRYFGRFHLTFDGRGPGFVDSVGVWHEVPPETARMVTFNMAGPFHGTPGYIHADRIKRLLFLDTAGTVVQILPYYGWNISDLEDWAHGAGWDTDITNQQFTGTEMERDRIYPSYRSAPNAPVGLAYYAPAPRVPLGRKIKQRLRLSQQ